jgi:hypothetical protein
MHSYYYGVQTALAYIFNHFFFNAVHYAYLAKEYYPYKRKNPRSSNPHQIYEELYALWRDKDELDKYGIQTRVNLKNGVLVQESMNSIDAASEKIGQDMRRDRRKRLLSALISRRYQNFRSEAVAESRLGGSWFF